MKIDIDSIPLDPGCYIYRDNKGKVIYVGKAKSLKKRVRSYFQGRPMDPKTTLMVSEIASLDFFVTNTEIEAFVLENNLINKYKPKYNINLKDSHRYAYIQVTDEKYPRLLVARERTGEGNFYGPFVNAEDRDNIIKALRKSFGIRTCKRLRKRPCLRSHIGLCSAPCIGNISEEEYGKNMRSIERFLDGKVDDLIRDMNKEMILHSELNNFEKALILRNQVNALKVLKERQRVEMDKKYDEDIINYILDGDAVYLIVFNILHGVLDTKNEFVFPYMDGFFEDFITQFYSSNAIPREIIIPEELSDEAIAVFLKDRRRGPVKITIPKRGKKVELLELAKINIESKFLRYKLMMEDLKKRLRLPNLPNVIECIDISHLSGSYTVGSMVQFRQGKPDKSNYRRFKIRSIDGIDDFASIGEIVRRRYTRLKDKGERMPDLIIIDGGKGQLTSAYKELKSLGLKVPIISIAKRNEEIFVPGLKSPLNIPKRSMAMQLIENARDESHRFAINYHKLLRSKGMTEDV